MARYSQSGRCAEVYFDLWHQNMEVASPNWLQGWEAAGWGWCAQAICTKDMILLFLSDMMWYVICSFFAQLFKGKIQHIFRSWFSILFTSAFTQNVGRITSAVTLILSSSPVGHLFRDRGRVWAGLRWIVGIRGPSNTQWLVAALRGSLSILPNLIIMTSGGFPSLEWWELDGKQWGNCCKPEDLGFVITGDEPWSGDLSVFGIVSESWISISISLKSKI